MARDTEPTAASNPLPRLPRGAAVVVTLLVLAAVVARLPPALHDALWLDETVSARIISAPTLGSALSRVRQTESSPPGWHVANQGLRAAAGGSISMERLRLLSILFGVLLTALVVAYALLLELPLWSAGIAGLLAALGTNFVAHGAELRPYALLALIAPGFGLAVQHAVRSPTAGRLALVAGIVAIGALTHYFFLLSVAAAGLWLVVAAPAAARARVATAMGIGLVPLAPWLPSFVHQYRHNLYAYVGPFNARDVVYAYARIVGLLGERGALLAAGRLAFALLVLSGIAVLARRRDGSLVATMAAGPVALAAVLWALGPHIFNERNLLVAGPFAALSVAAALAAMPRAVAVGASLLLLAAVGSSIWRFESDFGRADYDGIAQALVQEGWQPGDVVAQFGPAPLGIVRPVGWYLPGRPVLLGAHDTRCAQRLFVVSYDARGGPAWLRRHRARVLARRTFTAYDHTPRGPRTEPPIVVAALGRPGALATDARKHGGRLYTAVRCSAAGR